jgi:hypothetical protein
VRSQKHSAITISSLLARITTICKSVPSEAFDELNKQCRNGFLQRIEKLQPIRFHPLWRGPNGPMVIFLEITVFLSVPEHCSNGRDASNGHIASPWRSVILCCSAIPMRFKFHKPSFCEVLYGTSCNFSNFAFFLLSFLAFFPVI